MNTLLKPGKFQDKKIIITGGLGFIGSNLAHRLVEYGAEVLLVDSLIPEYGGNLFNIQDIKNKIPVTAATTFMLNSSTKPVTAAAILQLAVVLVEQQGREQAALEYSEIARRIYPDVSVLEY